MCYHKFPTLTCVVGNDWVRSSEDNVLEKFFVRKTNPVSIVQVEARNE